MPFWHFIAAVARPLWRQCDRPEAACLLVKELVHLKSLRLIDTQDEDGVAGFVRRLCVAGELTKLPEALVLSRLDDRRLLRLHPAMLEHVSQGVLGNLPVGKGRDQPLVQNPGLFVPPRYS